MNWKWQFQFPAYIRRAVGTRGYLYSVWVTSISNHTKKRQLWKIYSVLSHAFPWKGKNRINCSTVYVVFHFHMSPFQDISPKSRSVTDDDYRINRCWIEPIIYAKVGGVQLYLPTLTSKKFAFSLALVKNVSSYFFFVEGHCLTYGPLFYPFSYQTLSRPIFWNKWT